MLKVRMQAVCSPSCRAALNKSMVKASTWRSCSERRVSSCKAEGDNLAVREAAVCAVEKFVQNGNVVALGRGEVSQLIFGLLREQLDNDQLQDVVCLPTCDFAASEAAFHGLPQTSIGAADKIDVAFQEVDVLDTSDLSFTMGCASEPAQPNIMRARLAMNDALQCVALVDSETKIVERLNGIIPVVINNNKWEDTAETLDDIFLGEAEIWRRGAEPDANPRGGTNPYISKDGHNIVDVRFYEPFTLYGEICPYKKLSFEIMAVEGVVTHGLVLEKATAAIIATAEGPKVLYQEDEHQAEA